MLVEYWWTTKKRQGIRAITTHWVGLFLFGFIPLWIRPANKEWV